MTYEEYLREFEPNSVELDEDGNYIGDQGVSENSPNDEFLTNFSKIRNNKH